MVDETIIVPEYIAIEKLEYNTGQIPGLPKNPRFIKNTMYKKLVLLLKEDPEMLKLRELIVYPLNDKFVVIGGNQRLKASRELDYKKVLCKVLPKDTPVEKMQAYAIKDNVPFGQNDWQLLKTEWKDMPLEKWGVDPKGWDVKTIEDAPPALGDKPVSKLGEIYRLGRHRLICGDATKPEDVTKLMGGIKADMIFTDPPYNLDYEGKTADALKIENDKFKTNEAFFQFLLASFKNLAENSKSGAAIYVCHADSEGLNFRRAFLEAGFLLKQCIIWNKNTIIMGRQDYHWKHEPILYGWREGASHSWYGDRSQTTVWDVERPSRSSEHPTMKPIALVAQALKNSSKGEDIILDLFAGSGSTLMACEQTGRISYSMELDPRYCDVIRKRYANFIEEGDSWQEITPAII